MNNADNTQTELTKIQQLIAATQEALKSLPPAQLEAALAPLRAQEATLLGERAVLVRGNVGGSIITGNNNKIKIVNNIYHGPPTDDPAQALRIYREVLLNDTNQLGLDGLDVSAADPTSNARALRLAHVYVTLNTTHKQTIAEGSREDNSEESIPITALGACGRDNKLVLTGDPGGGKSTFVNHLAYALCAHQLARPGDWRAQLTPEHNSLRPAQLDLLPLKLILRDFAATLPTDPRAIAEYKKKTPPLLALTQFITAQLQRQNLGFVEKPLFEELQAGRVWLLLDGLDEVTNPSQRELVRAAVLAFAQRYPDCRYTVTCRILAYEDKSYQLADFAKYELDEFDEEQRQRFVQGWYDELVARERLDRGKADILAGRLRQSIQARADLRRLAGNPLLLTIMALVNTHKTALPEGRAQLYEEVVEMLLWRWEAVKLEQNEGVTLRQLLEQVGRTDQELQRALAQVALTVHAQIGAEDDTEKVADVSRQQLYDALAPFSADHGWAQQMVAVMQARAGLLVERLPHLFTFPHRTFQEYLAGVALANSHDKEGQPDFPQRAVAVAHLPQWRTVILLAVGYLIYVKPEPYRVLALLAELCPTQPRQSETGWRQVWLAGEVVLEMKAQRMQDTEQGRTLLPRIRQRLTELISTGQLPPRERAEAGDVLAELGDPRRGITEVDQMELCLVPGGRCWLGDDKSGKGRWYDGLDQPYWLARYPVTVGQWRQFVQISGHEPNRSRSLDAPDNQPVVWVNWYDAVAFCAWLNERWQEAGWLPEGYVATLPSEAEWEKGARGVVNEQVAMSNEQKFVVPNALRASLVAASRAHPNPKSKTKNPKSPYPWGDAPEVETNEAGETVYRSNCKSTGIERVCAVGSFPAGDSPVGCAEMSGQMWEWTRTKDDGSDPVQLDLGQEAINAPANKRSFGSNLFERKYLPEVEMNFQRVFKYDSVVLRGGGYHWEKNVCSVRFAGSPDGTLGVGGDVGWRVCVSPFSPPPAER